MSEEYISKEKIKEAIWKMERKGSLKGLSWLKKELGLEYEQ